MKKNKDFLIGELMAVESNITVLRACPAIPFSVANIINTNYGPVQTILKQHNEKLELYRERAILMEQEKDNNPEKFKKDVESANKEFLDLFKAKHKVEVTIVSLSTFEGVDIEGEKEVKQQDGSIAKFSYRDAYFGLVGLGLIA